VLVAYLALLWPWGQAVPLYNRLLVPVTRALMLPFDPQVQVAAEGTVVRCTREVDSIRDPQGRHYPTGLGLDTRRVTMEWPFLLALFAFTPALPWRRRLALTAAGLGALLLLHAGACWVNAMAVSFQNTNLTVDLATAKIVAKGPNPWHDALTHFQYTGAVLALLVWATLAGFFAGEPAPDGAAQGQDQARTSTRRRRAQKA
jgi:hypothetical protein